MDMIQEQETKRMLAMGTSQKEVSNLTGLSPASISRFAKKHREDIEREGIKLLESLPDIIEHTKRDIKAANEVSKYLVGGKMKNPTRFKTHDSLLKFQEQTYKKSADILRATGILPSQNQSVLVQNIFQDNRTQIISPNVLQVLGESMRHIFEDPDVIEVGVDSYIGGYDELPE